MEEEIMNKTNKTNAFKHKSLIKVLCIILSIIISFGSFVTLTFSNLFLSDFINIGSLFIAEVSTSSIPAFFRYDELDMGHS